MRGDGILDADRQGPAGLHTGGRSGCDSHRSSWAGGGRGGEVGGLGGSGQGFCFRTWKS